MEAIQVQTNIRKIRLLFATICIHCQPVNPSAKELWNIFRDDLISDFIKQGDPIEVAESKALAVSLSKQKKIKLLFIFLFFNY